MELGIKPIRKKKIPRFEVASRDADFELIYLTLVSFLDVR